MRVMNPATVSVSRVSCMCYSLFLNFCEHDLSYFFVIKDVKLLSLNMLHKDSHQILFIIMHGFY